MNALPGLLTSGLTYHELMCVSTKKLIEKLNQKSWLPILRTRAEVMFADKTACEVDKSFGDGTYNPQDAVFQLDEQTMMKEDAFEDENVYSGDEQKDPDEEEGNEEGNDNPDDDVDEAEYDKVAGNKRPASEKPNASVPAKSSDVCIVYTFF